MTAQAFDTVLIRDVVSYSVAGGWGSDVAAPGDCRVKVVRGADFPSAALQLTALLPVRYEPVSRAEPRILRDGDIIMEISGGTNDRPTGRTVLITKKMIQSTDCPLIPASFCRLLRVDGEHHSPRFTYYALQSFYQAGLSWEYQNRSTGLSNFQYPIFAKSYSIPTPSLREQNSIAAVLGILDDKIAANAELARTADDLACALFDRAAEEASWASSTFGDLCTVGGGGTPRSAEPAFWSGAVPWATPTDVTRLLGPYLRRTARQITDVGLASCTSPLYPVGSILMTSRATIGAFAIAEIATAVNQGFIVVNPKDEALRYWVLHDMRSRVGEFTSFANGATFLELSRGNFKKLPVRLANDEVMLDFCSRTSVLHGRASQALHESDSLAQLRDVLLPQLMSGRLTVRDAEKTVSDAV